MEMEETEMVEMEMEETEMEEMEMEEMEMEEMEMEEMEMEEMEIEEKEMVLGTEENMAITSEDLCLLKRVVGLARWFEKMETVFYISNCPEKYQVKNEIQKMETELWNLTVKGNDLTVYTQRFQELILLCTRMVPNKEDRVERFIGGLTYNIQGNVIAANPVRFQDAVRIANQLMDKKLQGYAARSAESKRRMESDSKINQPFKIYK
ncbi:reverse transcriptase domain-containing protein [Tanacetum coccineum]